MKITDIDVESILYFDPTEKEEFEADAKYNKSFFGRFFGQGRTGFEEGEPYWHKIDRYGRDTLERELYGDVVGYSYDDYPVETGVVLTEHFMIFPASEIIRFDEIEKFGLFNHCDSRLHKFIMDRLGQPYDPYIINPRYEEDPDEELESGAVLYIVTKEGKLIQDAIDLEVQYRKELVDLIATRSGAPDLSTEDVLEGRIDRSYVEGIE